MGNYTGESTDSNLLFPRLISKNLARKEISHKVSHGQYLYVFELVTARTAVHTDPFFNLNPWRFGEGTHRFIPRPILTLGSLNLDGNYLRGGVLLSASRFNDEVHFDAGRRSVV